jgi:hypothetical protein
MKRDCFAHLKDTSPFHGLFPRGKAPIVSFIAQRALLNDIGMQPVYFLDVERCSPEQLEGVAKLVASLLGGAVEEVLEQVRTHGMPIRESEVSFTSGGPNTVRMLL